MPSGNKIIGHVHDGYMNLEIYISSKTITHGLCGSFDGNSTNDIYNRFTNDAVGALIGKRISASVATSWR